MGRKISYLKGYIYVMRGEAATRKKKRSGRVLSSLLTLPTLAALLVAMSGFTSALAGPPFRTDDPETWRDLVKPLPFGRASTPEEIAAAIAFLASEQSGYTSGTVLTIDAGISARSG